MIVRLSLIMDGFIKVSTIIINFMDGEDLLMLKIMRFIREISVMGTFMDMEQSNSILCFST